MRIAVSTFLFNGEEKFLGAGPVELLRGISQTGSIRRAAMLMGLSYSKAHKMISRLDRTLPSPVLVRRVGGIDRGGAELTEYGRQVLVAYDLLHQRICDYANQEFAEFQQQILR